MACRFGGKNSSATVGFFFINLKVFLFGFLFLVLQDFILIHQESGLCGKPYWAVPIYLGHFGYLYVTVIFFGDEGDLNRKEVIGLPSNAELKAATLIFGINHW